MRITTYTVPAWARQILDFYRAALAQGGWTLYEEKAGSQLWDYENSADQPPFQVGIFTTERADQTTELEIRRIIYGPFRFSSSCTSPYP